MARKILILSTSAGSGHVRAAQALESECEISFSDYEAVHIDMMDIVPGFFRKVYSESYIKLIERHPALWGYLYSKSDKTPPSSPFSKLRKKIEKLNTIKFSKVLKKEKADIIICTHFLPAELLSKMREKGKLETPVYVVVTDFDLHKLWIHPHISGYFAASEGVKWRMTKRGIPEENIKVTGIPIMPVFNQKHSRNECCSEIGLSPNKTTLMILGGGAGVGSLDEFAESILNISNNFQLIALAGRNEALLEKLQKLSDKFPSRLYASGFTNTIERLMACSDAAITKPGGLTSSECMALGLPMLIIDPIPGQEERNADYLLEKGAALKAIDEIELEYKVRLLLENPKKLQDMKNCALKISTPDSAKAVLDSILG